MPHADYGELLALLETAGDPGQEILVAHSRGALDALASREFPAAPLFLLAPSVPRRRRGTHLVIAMLQVAGSMPIVRGALARRLRDATYRRYGADAPTESPLDLAAAAERLGPPQPIPASTGSRPLAVIVSSDDPRYADQLLFAARLGATVLHHPGGHLFPITHPASTAQTISDALASS